METNRIYRTGEFYNCFHLNHKGIVKEVNNIILYKGDKKVYEFRWFADKINAENFVDYPNKLMEVVFSKEIKRRIKIKNDGEIFFVKIKQVYSFEKDEVDLYIPIEELNPKEYKRKTIEFEHHTSDYIFYETNKKNVYFMQTEEKDKTLNNKKNDKINELIKKEGFKEIDIEYQVKKHTEKLNKLTAEILKIRDMNKGDFNKYQIVEVLEKK